MLSRARSWTCATALWLSVGLLLDLTPVSIDTGWAQGIRRPKAVEAKKNKRRPKVQRNRAPKGPGVRVMFQRAQRLYDAGKYQGALSAYDAILKRYPGHEPTVIQLAKTLYRLDRITEAYNVFARVNPQYFDPETSYEYGWSFYNAKKWEGALYAFKKVPKGHSLYDLANYYGAVSAIKLRKLDEASDMLDKAVVLPSKLAKSRALYAKHLQALQLMEEKSELAKERQKERRRLLRPVPAGQRRTDTAELKEQPPEDTGYRGVKQDANVQYRSENQLQDYHGLRDETYTYRIGRFNFASGPKFTLPFGKIEKRSVAAGLQLDLGAEDRQTTGTRVVIENSDADNLHRVQSEKIAPSQTQAGEVAAEPWFEIPLPQATWFVVGGAIRFYYPDFERQNRTGSRDSYMELAGEYESIEWRTRLIYSEILDRETEVTTITTGVEAESAYNFSGGLSLRANFNHDLYNYLIPALEINGPNTQSSLTTTLSQALAFGLKLSARAGYAYQSNYLVHGIETYGRLAADGQTISGRVAMSIAPVSWLSAAASYTAEQTTWTTEFAEAQEVFERNVVDVTGTTSLSIVLGLAF